MSTTAPHTIACHWQTAPTPHAQLNDWLFDQGSLTQRLTQLCRTAFTVKVIDEGWHTLTADECQALAITPGSCGWVREVFLCDGEQPWIFARSVAGQTALQSSDFAISELGTRSLGATLFSQHAFKRGPMYIQRLDCAQLPISVQHYTQQQPHVWARRSCFTKNALGILVAEVFLPQLWHDTQQLECNRL